MAHLRRLAWLPLAAAVACNANKGPALRFIVAPTALGDGRCYEPDQPPPQGNHVSAAISPNDADRIASVRLTIRTYAPGDDTGNFVCDRVLDTRGNPSIRIPGKNVDRVDLYAEAWAPPGPGETLPHRVAVGALTNVPATATQLPDLRLYPDERFRCHNAHLGEPRAFHTATRLPNGQVLIVGGLVPTDATGDAFNATLGITPDIEVYDPATAAFYPVTEAGAATPRAFHQAVLVGATPPYQILLVGGATIAAASPPSPAFGLNNRVPPGTRLVPFDTSGVPNPLPVSAAPAELLSYDPATKTSTRTALAGFKPGIFQAATGFTDGIAVAGGVDYMGSPLTMTTNDTELDVSRGGEPPRTAMLPTPRMGATMTPLSDNTALLWGGQITPTDPAGYLVSGLGAMNTPTLLAAPLASAPVTQFHTATLLPPSPTTSSRNILVTGGFVETTTAGGQAVDPPAPGTEVRILTVTMAGVVTEAAPMLSGYESDATCTAADRLRPAGFESAVDLGRGRVLITGGAPTITAMCNDCDGGSDFRCATQQASLFTAPSTLAPTNSDPTERMQIPRYGHTSTLLADGNVLIVGGIGSPAGTPRVLGDVEVYNPRPVIPVYDATSGMPDPDDPIAGDMLVRDPGAQLNDPAHPPCAEFQ